MGRPRCMVAAACSSLAHLSALRRVGITDKTTALGCIAPHLTSQGVLLKRLTMATLNGTWIYQSFRPNGGAPPLVPWTPRGELAVTTDATGKVDGTLTFPPRPGTAAPGAVFAIRGSITPAIGERVPEGIELTGEGLGAVYKI